MNINNLGKEYCMRKLFSIIVLVCILFSSVSLVHARRYFDAAIGRWLIPDPALQEQNPHWLSKNGYFSVSPYVYCFNNPMIYIDPNGMNPVYDQNGNFLGTDDTGLMGQAIVMNADNFTQGMTNEDALKNGTLFSKFGGSDEVKKLISSHFSGLSERPDWNGIVTIAEGIAWAKSHPNNSGSPNDALYLDASKMDFGSLSMGNFKQIGQSQPINLLWETNLLDSRSINTTYALGRTYMTLVSPILGGVVRVENGYWNKYDWDYGGGPIRNTLIFLNRISCGLNNSHGFPINVYGTGLLNR